jgi:tetratricopeptide (TPR) repeat protein
MRPFALIFLVAVSLSSAAAARMNADPHMCEPGRSRSSSDAVGIDDRIRMHSEWLRKAEGQALGNALLQRAALYREKRDWRLAIDDLERAEAEFERSGYPPRQVGAPEVPSSRAQLLADRGAAHREAGEYEESLHDLDAALRDSPGFSHGYIERGLTNLRAARNDQAIEDFNHVLVNDASNVDYVRVQAYGLRASAWLDKDKEAYRARHDTDAANALSYGRCTDVKDNYCWLEALWSHWRNGLESGDALRDYWWGYQLHDCSPEVADRPNLLDSRALAYLQLGQLSDARASAEAATRGDPGDGEKHYMLATIKEAAGDRAQAESDFARARALAKPGDWERWERQQGRFRTLPLPESPDRQAAKIVDESFKVLEKEYSHFSLDRPIPGSSEVLKGLPEDSSIVKRMKQEYSRFAGGVARPNPGNPPLRVAVLAFEDNSDGSPARCRRDVAASVADNLARFNRAVGRTVFTMGTPESHDVLFVFGGPLSVPDLKVDPAMQQVLDAEVRQTSEPNDERFASFDAAGVEPLEGANLHYRKSDGELLYANIARTWSGVSKECSVEVVRDLVRAMTDGNSLRLNWSGLASSEHFNLPEKAQPVREEIEACFLLQEPSATTDRRAECVRMLAVRGRDK